MMQKVQTINDLAMDLNISEQKLWYFFHSINSNVKKREEKKKNGKIRLIHSPSREFKKTLRQLNEYFLHDNLFPSTLHGSVRGKSPITNAAVHVGQPSVVNLDIKDFYPSIHHSRVYQVFINLGYSSDVARFLTRLTTFDGHLAQGFPTSSTIANCVLTEIEPRFHNLCSVHDLNMTFYQDDLTFSGSVKSQKLVNLMIRMLADCGFEINREKIEILPFTKRQEVTGLVVNKKVNISKKYYRNLRATIHNCVIWGVESQITDPNMDAEQFLQSLQSKINWVKSVNKSKGEKLLTDFAKINLENSKRISSQ